MQVSAIIPAYNAERFLRRAVESLLSTSYPNLEIVIIDDGSQDTTLQVGKMLHREHPGIVKVIQHPDQRNHGVSASRNLGIKDSTGELICFLDADDYVLPHRFETAVPLLQNNPTIDGVYELTSMEFDGPSTEKSRFWNDRMLFGIDQSIEHKLLLPKLLEGTAWPSSALIVRREFIQKSGVFDETMSFAEDCNLWMRMSAIGRIVAGNMLEPVSVYLRHGQNTYQGELERKVDLLRAMNAAWQWAKKKSLHPDILRVFRNGVELYLINGVIVARESGRPEVAWQLLRSVLPKNHGIIIFNKKMLKQIGWLIVESFGFVKREYK